jgi:hypothetical protein
MSRRLVFAAVIWVCVASVSAADPHLSVLFGQHVRAYLRLDAAARADSRQGDIFKRDVVDDFRKIIRKAFKGKDGRNMRRTIRESDAVRPTILRVNDIYPEDIPLTTMPPTLLRQLPTLPAELAYRLIGGALVLQELKTNMIVDFIPEAIPALKK